MFHRELMIAGLKKQQDMLGELIAEIDRTQKMTMQDSFVCERRAQLVARNLNKLRRIKKAYFLYQDGISCQ